MPEANNGNPPVNEATPPVQTENNPNPSAANENPTQEGVPTDPAPRPTESLLGGEKKPETEPQPQDEGAPEVYANFKGENGIEFSADQLKGFTDVARELNLSQEKAQKLFGVMMPTARDYLTHDLAEKTKVWVEETMKDPEVGGADFKEKQGIATAAYQKYATPELRALLNGAGLGCHPEVFRLFYRLGKGMQQDSGVAGSASSPNNAPRRRYPNSNMVADMN